MEDQGIVVSAQELVILLSAGLRGDKRTGAVTYRALAPVRLQVPELECVPVALVVDVQKNERARNSNSTGVPYKLRLPPRSTRMAPLAESEKLKALHEAAKTAARHLAQAQEREYAALDVITQANKALLNGVEWYDAHFALGNLTDSVNMRTSVTGSTPAPPPPVRGNEFKADAEAVVMKLAFLIDSATARASAQATPHDAADVREANVREAAGAGRSGAPGLQQRGHVRAPGGGVRLARSLPK
jgi:hypothetical protein